MNISKSMPAILVHDIGSPHPRLPYFDNMVAHIAKAPDGLTISINPGGNILYPGIKSIEVVRTRKVPLAVANTALLSSIDPRLGFVSLPFTISDELMLVGTNPENMVKLIQTYLKPAGLKILGLMRGADAFFIMKAKHIHRIADLKGMRIRVSAPGIYEEVLKSLDAKPNPLAPSDVDGAFKRGALDGMVSSPGGWILSGPAGPRGSLVPGLIFYTYSMIADQVWFDGLETHQQKTLEEAARIYITEKWQDMKKDDGKVISDFIAEKGGALTFTAVPADKLGPWKEKVKMVVKKFEDTYPEVVKAYHSLIVNS